MRKSGFSGEQIIRILREYEAGLIAGARCRPHPAIRQSRIPLIPGRRWGPDHRITCSHPMTCGLTPFGKGHLNYEAM